MDKKEQTEIFAERLNKALKERNMKAVTLTKETGMSKVSISRYRHGYAIPARGKIISMAQVLGVSPMWLLGFTEDPSYDSLSEADKKRDYLANIIKIMDEKQLDDMIKFAQTFVINKKQDQTK